MKGDRNGLLVAALVVIVVAAGIWWWRNRSTPSATSDLSRASAAAEPAATEAWRANRAVSLQAPDGWLSVAGLAFPNPGRNRVGSHPDNEVPLPPGSAPSLAAHVIAEGPRLWLELQPGVEGTFNDEPLRGRVELRTADAAADRAADRVQIGRITLQAHPSGDRLGIRLRDPESPIRTGFKGLRWYPIDSRWRIEGRFVPYDETRVIPIQNVLGDLVDEPSPGEVEFELQGRTVRLVALDAGKRLWFVFRDGTAGSETYSTRFLYADKADARGVVTLDFNRAYNPPCAYNPYTTCPLPPPENRLEIAIPAGEKLYEVARE